MQVILLPDSLFVVLDVFQSRHIIMTARTMYIERGKAKYQEYAMCKGGSL